MERIEARGMALGERAAAVARERLAERAGDALPGVAAEVEGERVVLSGRGLGSRLLREPVLRWIGSLMQ
jgi:hypothetical protein